MNTAAAVAQHLNIAEQVILRIEEWAHVLFVRFTTGRPRFVSKKVIAMAVEKLAVGNLIEIARYPQGPYQVVESRIHPTDGGHFILAKNLRLPGADVVRVWNLNSVTLLNDSND